MLSLHASIEYTRKTYRFLCPSWVSNVRSPPDINNSIPTRFQNANKYRSRVWFSLLISRKKTDSVPSACAFSSFVTNVKLNWLKQYEVGCMQQWCAFNDNMALYEFAWISCECHRGNFQIIIVLKVTKICVKLAMIIRNIEKKIKNIQTITYRNGYRIGRTQPQSICQCILRYSRILHKLTQAILFYSIHSLFIEICQHLMQY